MIKAIILLLIGFVLLIKSSDIFVDAISSIAANFKMSKTTIALTVAAFGTCAPELAISFNSIANGNGDIALANVLGSNIINILLIIGLAALIFPIKVKNDTIKKEMPILLFITTFFVISITLHFIDVNSASILTRADGFMLVALFMIFMFYIFSIIKSNKNKDDTNSAKYKLVTSIILTIVCCVVIVFASNLIVENAKEIATLLNISVKIITMTVVVIGTSLPELTMTIVAAKKGEFDIALGNIIGTNIFNIGIVLGLPLIIYGGFSSTSFNLVDILVVDIAAILLYNFAKNDKIIKRKEGIMMIATFLVYYIYLFCI